MKIWRDEEVKSLFDSVEKCKSCQISLKKAFVEHAGKFGRKPNSVRNYYYHEVDNLKVDKTRCDRLLIDISKHNKISFENFEKEESELLLARVDEMLKKGESVRSACYKLSDGNLTEMTRLQNKYQNLKKKTKNFDNVIKFKQKSKILTDNDINSLFIGLVKLIKKNAIDEYIEKNSKESQAMSVLLKKAFFDLGKKEKELSQLKGDFERLKEENQELSKICKNLTDKKEVLKEHLLKKRIQNSLENKV